MNRRLQQFLSAENISQSQFADTIGVARASVSHILAGRNKPGFDFISSMARHYPSLNLDWLITGKGKMYSRTEQQLPEPLPVTLFEEEKPDIEDMPDFGGLPETVKATTPERTARPRIESRPDSAQPSKARNIARIVVFYDDNTYQELK